MFSASRIAGLLHRFGKATSYSGAALETARPDDIAPLAAEPAPRPEARTYQGEVFELSREHAAGWIWDHSRPDERIAYQARVSGDESVVASGRADKWWWGLPGRGIGDGRHAFWLRFSRPLTDAELRQVEIRAVPDGAALPRSASLTSAYEPVYHVAMDIVDNCNLRCPFCLYDYSNTYTTHLMSEETLRAALRFLPYVKDGEFWFSCLHEPTLHPRVIEFVERVPREYRRKLFYTTNLAKRMPERYFEWLAGNGMHHVNISIESRSPALYERMRKGGRFGIFQENWDKLTTAVRRAPDATPVHYIAMAYKSNLRELPELARYLLDEREASQLEVRYTFDVPHLAPDFRAAEFLDDEDWDWLEGQLAAFPGDKVRLWRPARRTEDTHDTPPPASPASTTSPRLLGPVLFRLSWDGTLRVRGLHADSRGDAPEESELLATNIGEVADAEALVDDLTRRAFAIPQSDVRASA
jgi:sulfatase maturation enzyme AslB (radical SAM superfamily)